MNSNSITGAANSTAIAAPIPREPPVIRIVLLVIGLL